jgi:hypothetical protein
VWEYKHTSLCKYDNWSKSQVPFYVKFNKHTNENIFLVISFISLLRCHEAILSDDNENCCIDERHQENVSHHTDIVLCYVFVSHVVSNKVKHVSNYNVYECDPGSKSFCLILLNISNGGPVFAVLLAIGK